MDIERVNGSNMQGDTIGWMPHTFYPVKYQNKHVEIDFFKSLGRLQVFILRALWYSDSEGNMSICAEPISETMETQENWRKRYWENFYKGATTKLKDWAYENEYRLILNDMFHDFDTPESRSLKYEFDALDGIIFGIKTTANDKLRIMKIIDDKCLKYKREDFNFYQAYYSKTDGKIKYELLDLIKPG